MIKESLHNYYMFYTTLVAALTAGVNLFIIFWMSGYNPFVKMIFEEVFDTELKLISLDYGLGLAAIGIITFFGVSLSSSIFEKYKDKPKTETVSSENLVSRVVIGKGIMRKAIAASLVMTYIVLIGLSFSAGSLNNSLSGSDSEDDSDDSTTKVPIFSNSNDVNTNIVIKDIVTFDKIKVTTTNETSKSLQEVMLEKEPDTLVEHFTMVISVVIGFYFSSNILNAVLKSRNEGKTLNNPLEILKVRLATSDISKEEYEKLKALIDADRELRAELKRTGSKLDFKTAKAMRSATGKIKEELASDNFAKHVAARKEEKDQK